MCYNGSVKLDRVLRLNWLATGDQLKPLRSTWSLDISQGVTADVAPGCNAFVMRECETAMTRVRRAKPGL